MDTAVTLHVAKGPIDLEALRPALRGRLILRSDPAFVDERLVWNAAVQGTPMAIVRVADADDVAATVAFARRNALEIAVRSGGHSLAGHSTGDGVLVIDTRDLRGLHIDVDRGVAWAGAGLSAGEVTRALAEHGMAVPFGDTASVGIGGLTLGGGIGWLARKHGLTIDNLESVELVTADGRVLTASAEEHADLFWALRGGGGNFGVATRFCYRLVPVSEVLGGAVVLPVTRDVLRNLAPLAMSAPEELTTIGFIMPTPPMPFVAEEHHGKLGLALMFVYAGDPADGQAAIEPFTKVAEPYGVAAMPMPYPAIYDFTAEGETRQSSTTRSVFLDALDDATIDDVVAALEGAPDGTMVQIRVFGGAMGRVPADATAFAHRSAAVQVTIINGLTAPEAVPAALTWNRALYCAIAPRSSGVYVNFLEDEGGDRIRQAYPGNTYARLAEVKRRYDPSNVFHRNQNVRPG